MLTKQQLINLFSNFAAVKQKYTIMETTFTYTVYRYLDGFWSCVRRCHGLEAKQTRRLIALAIRLGYTYSPTHRAYIRKNSDGNLNSIARFKREQL